MNIIETISDLSGDLGIISITLCKLSRLQLPGQASDILNQELLMAIYTWPALQVYFRNFEQTRIPVLDVLG